MHKKKAITDFSLTSSVPGNHDSRTLRLGGIDAFTSDPQQHPPLAITRCLNHINPPQISKEFQQNCMITMGNQLKKAIATSFVANLPSPTRNRQHAIANGFVANQF